MFIKFDRTPDLQSKQLDEYAKTVVAHALTEKPKYEVDDKDEKFEAAEAAPARHLDDFAPPPPPLRISLIWKGRGKERMRETVAG